MTGWSGELVFFTVKVLRLASVSVQHIMFCLVLSHGLTQRFLQISGKKATVLRWEGAEAGGRVRDGRGLIGRSSVPLDVVRDRLQGFSRVSVHVHILAKTTCRQ